jgi:hypothetical protein
MQYPAEMQERFKLIAELYRAAHDLYFKLNWPTASSVPETSLASRCRKDLAALHPSPPRFAEQAIDGTVRMFLYGAAVSAGEMASLYETGEIILAPMIVARTMLEGCAQIHWILGAGSEPLTNAVARALLVEIHGAKRALTLDIELHGPESEEAAWRGQYLDAAVDAAQAVFPSPDGLDPRNDKHLRLAGQAWRSYIDLQAEMTRVTRSLTGTDMPDMLRPMYRTLSANTHPTAHALRELFPMAVSNGDDTIERALAQELTFQEQANLTVLSVLRNAIVYVAAYYGLAVAENAHLARFEQLHKDFQSGLAVPPPKRKLRPLLD